jgi:hypothetical protein
VNGAVLDFPEETPEGPVVVTREAGSDKEEKSVGNLGEASCHLDKIHCELEDLLLRDPQMDCTVVEQAVCGEGKHHLGDEWVEPDLEHL